METIAITLDSAVSTLQILDRQARKDSGKVIRFTYGVYNVLTSAEAKRKYRIAREVAGRIAEIVVLIAIALASDLDRWIQSHEQSQVVEPEVEVEVAETTAPVEVERINTAAILEEIQQVTAPVFKRSRKKRYSSKRSDLRSASYGYEKTRLAKKN